MKLMNLAKKVTMIAVSCAMVVSMVAGLNAKVMADEFTLTDEQGAQCARDVDNMNAELKTSEGMELNQMYAIIRAGSFEAFLARTFSFNEELEEPIKFKFESEKNRWVSGVEGVPPYAEFSVRYQYGEVKSVRFYFFSENDDGENEEQIFTFTRDITRDVPEPVSEPCNTKQKEAPVPVDADTFKSEVPHGTACVANANSKVGDLKVHKIDTKTEVNQKALADAFAVQHGKKAKILVSTSVYPRRELGVDAGKKEAIMWANLDKKVQPVYAVCYNQTDKAYYLAGTLDKNGVATLPNFVLRPATNITIFTLE